MTLAYCADLARRVQRLRSLYERRAPDEIFAVMETPRRTLADFAARYQAGPCAFPELEERAAFWDAYWRESAGVLDDRVPAAYLSELDQGLYGGLVGARATFTADPASGWISSMVPPLLADWSEFARLRMDENGEWARRYETLLAVFTRAARGRFGISHFILIDGLNFVFELFGATRTYLDLEENPGMIRRAIEFAYELNGRVQDEFFAAGPLIEGGTCSNMCSWVPGRIVSESVDPFHMTSVDYLRRWGVEPIERILARYDGGVTHIHGNGRHLIEAVSQLRGLRAICLGDDTGYPAAIDVLPELRRRAGSTPLAVNVPFSKFSRLLADKNLTGNVLYLVGSVPDQDTANRTMDQVRRYRVS